MSNSQRWTAVLGELIRCAEDMLVALTRENEALVEGNHESLALVTDAKTQLVDRLERLETERRELAEPGEATADPGRQQLRDLIARCKAQNERNGTLLKARAENVRIALKTLRGAEPELYGATGRTPARADARPLGTA